MNCNIEVASQCPMPYGVDDDGTVLCDGCAPNMPKGFNLTNTGELPSLEEFLKRTQNDTTTDKKETKS